MGLAVIRRDGDVGVGLQATRGNGTNGVAKKKVFSPLVRLLFFQFRFFSIRQKKVVRNLCK